MLWDPFLMKKLLKSEIYESMNNARIHYSQKKKSTSAATKKKKRLKCVKSKTWTQ